MVKEAESHADADKKRKEVVEARNKADAAIYTAEKQLKEAGERAPAAIRREIEKASSALKDAVGGDDGKLILQLTEALTKAVGRLVEASQKSGAPGGHAAHGTDGNPDVVDAEFEEVGNPNRKAS
jgi:molecular chaperone DnaK